MIKNELKVITKDWFKKNIISFDKDFLSKKYTNIKENNKIKEQLIKIFGSEFMEQIDGAGTENDLFNKKVRRETTIVKIVEINELPSSNDADENIIYAIKDEKAIDEDCKYHLYVAVDDENEETKVWVEISSPSYIFETDNIDFETEFNNFDILFRRKYSYLNWEALQTKLLTFDENYNYSLNKKVMSGEFVYNKKEQNFPTVTLWYDGEKLYVDAKEYNGNKDILAQTILDEDSELKDENEVKYYYITVGSGGSVPGIYGSYDMDILANSGEDLSYLENIELVYDATINSNSIMYLYFKAEKLDGKEREDGSVYKYIGPKYTFLIYGQILGTDNFKWYIGSATAYGIFKFDGKKQEPVYIKSGDCGQEINEEYNNLIGQIDPETGRKYKGYKEDLYHYDEETLHQEWDNDVNAILNEE